MKLSYIDLEQAESRTVGAIIFRLFGDETYLNVQESGDPHTLVCSMCWQDLPWPSDFRLENLPGFGGRFPPDLVAEAEKVAGEKAYRDMTFRVLAKRLVHGSNYGGAPPTMAKHTHVDVKIIRDFQSAYFSAFPGIRRWHRWVAEQLGLTRQITTFLGRRRFFFGRPNDDATLREAIAFEPQSVATGDYTNFGLYSVWKMNWPLWLFAQVHDAVAFAYDERDEHWIIDAVCEKLQTEILLVAPDGRERPFRIPTEAFVGWNLGERTNENPDGLIEWTGRDDRQRTIPLQRKLADIRITPEAGLVY